MGQTPFSKPVLLRLSRTDHFRARTPLEALDYLRRHWPGGRTAHYRWAYTLCEAASKGRAREEDAYRALVDAAQRAGLLVSEASAGAHSGFASRTASLETSWPGTSDIHVLRPAPRSIGAGTASVDSLLASLSDRRLDTVTKPEGGTNAVERGADSLTAGDLK